MPLNADFAAVKTAVDLSVGTEVTAVQTLSGPLVGEIRDDGGAVVNLLARGIVMDDSTDNRSALQAEVSRAVAAPRYVPAGVMRLPVSATAESSYFGNQSTLAVHTAVKIATSGFTLEGPGVIRPWGYASAPTSGIVMPAFMTDKTTTLGALKNLTFRNLGFE
ncbi:MAG TPA: hypothetical protein VFH27_04880, partial [Longimicrobiaceae bacterium]|nr:hypothetical protein [Longimicrobiaceae bacterium]